MNRRINELFPEYSNIFVIHDSICIEWSIMRDAEGNLTEFIPKEGGVITGAQAKNECEVIKSLLEKNREALPKEIRNFPIFVRGI